MFWLRWSYHNPLQRSSICNAQATCEVKGVIYGSRHMMYDFDTCTSEAS